MPTRFTFYMDESGNTGDDLVGSDQSFFTLGGLGINNRRQNGISRGIEKIKKDYNLNFELKAKKLLGTKYEPAIPEMVECAMREDTIPFFTILEKRFMVAARIIENYFDPAYNQNTDNSWTFPLPIKNSLANHFYETLSSRTINATSLAMQKGTPDKVKEAYNLILDETKDEWIRKILSGAKNGLDELGDQIAQSRVDNPDSVPGGVLYSPNYTVYFEHLNKLEHLLRQRGASADIVFDSSRQYNQHFRTLFQRLKNLSESKLHFPQTTLYFGFKNLEKFNHKDSASCGPLQLADLIVSSISGFFKKLQINDGPWRFTSSEEFWLAFIFILMENNFGNWVMSDRLKIKYGTLIRTYLKRTSGGSRR